MAIQISTHGDVLRHAARRAAVAAGLTLVMTTATLLLQLGTDFSATVTVGHIVRLSLWLAALVSTLLAGVLSYRSALLMRQLTLTRNELAHISQTDQLTGLFNRRGFYDAAAPALASARLHSIPVAVFLCDIDHFKSVNDRYGHQAGDKVLVELADVLRQSAQREGALVARFGGEEFSGLLVGATRDRAERYAEALRSACAAREIGDGVERVTISIGFTVSCADAELTELIRSADRALYAAKRRGRDRVVEADRAPIAA